MKAFEAQKLTNHARYEKIMKEINNSINQGRSMHTFSIYSHSSIYIKESFIDEIVEKILEDGFDVEFYYNVYDQLEYVWISWENSKEGRRGILTKRKQDKEPAKKPSFWERLEDFFVGDVDDGDW